MSQGPFRFPPTDGKIGRNDYCPCGSGRKYKKCCIGRNWLVLREDEREAMRRAGRFNAQLMDFLRPLVVEGARGLEVDRAVREYTMDHGHTPACLGYEGYPYSICWSPNEVVAHGVPGYAPLRHGDIVNVDISTIVDGWHADQSEMFMIGDLRSVDRNLVLVARDCLYETIGRLEPGCTVNDAVVRGQHIAEEVGFSVVREYTGHGIGRQFHQAPTIFHFVNPGFGEFRLEPGMCFTIEPMINEGGWQTKEDPDGWTVRTVDGSLSAQWEHTVLMTEDGPEVLTETGHGRSLE